MLFQETEWLIIILKIVDSYHSLQEAFLDLPVASDTLARPLPSGEVPPLHNAQSITFLSLQLDQSSLRPKLWLLELSWLVLAWLRAK